MSESPDETVLDDEPVEGTGTEEESGTDEEKHEEELDLYNASHGKVPRTGGPYADDLQMKAAEEWRAEVEDREPDLDNPPATAGTLLVPKQYLRETDVDKSHFSDEVEIKNEPVQTVMVDTTNSEHTKPDPKQAAWDNDMQKVNALAAAKSLSEHGGVEDTSGYTSDTERGKARTTIQYVNK